MSTAERGRVLARMNSHDDLEFRNGIIKPLLTDLYQITMAYAYWKAGKGNEPAVFDLYFRKNPFQGEFTVFAGLEECIKFLQHFYFSDSDIAYLQSVLPNHVDPAFFTYLRYVTTKGVRMYAIDEGHVVFPKVPLIIMEGPLGVLQLMETSLLNLVNYASLVATNATRFRQAAGNNITLLEFGLRRAQGPDGGLSASRYCYLGGFDGTSNVLAGKLFGIPVKGTHAHAFVTSFQDISDISNRTLKSKEGSLEVDFVDLCLQWQEKLAPVVGFPVDQVNKGELAAFISYAQAFPHGFLALVDSYDVLKTGIPNFCTVAMALNELGYRALGVRIDSGDLAYLSNVIRKTFQTIASRYNVPWVEKLTVVASNDINEDTIHSLKQQGHSIDCFGIGTHLVTCQKQPALGCVYKLVEVGGRPSIKLSEDVEKLTIPGRKRAYRLYGSEAPEGNCLVDLMMQENESPPEIGVRTLCRHPFQESKRAYVIPAKVETLHKLYWDNEKVQQPLPGLETIREKARESLACLRQDHKRALNPTPYKVSVSSSLYDYIHDMWLKNAPIGELY